MTDYMPVVLAFVLGYLVCLGVSRYRWLLRRWISNHTPRRCPRCGSWHLDKHMRYTEHNVAGNVIICKRCYDAEFTPFSKDAK